MPSNTVSALETRARRAAERICLKAKRSRWRQGSIDKFGGSQLIDPNRNWIVDGEKYDLSPKRSSSVVRLVSSRT
jgi:hypothetical protein